MVLTIQRALFTLVLVLVLTFNINLFILTRHFNSSGHRRLDQTSQEYTKTVNTRHSVVFRPRNEVKPSDKKGPAPRSPSKFLYLVQTDICIPNYLSLPNILGDWQACDCELLVLSYKSRCSNNALPHVTYIFNSSTTWTTGRSLLYTTAMSRQEQYLYYVFMDDDAELRVKNKNDKINPWRWFESFLRSNEPPLAAADNPVWHLIDRIYERRYLVNDCAYTFSSTDEYFPAVWFDGMFNAMHYKAVRHIMGPVLPYWSKFDKTSWWFSEWYVNIMTDVAFHGQAILLGRVTADNAVHRPYLKQVHDAAVLKSVANDVRSVIPDKYRQATERLLKRWETEYVDILTTVTDTYCKPLPPPNPDLVPFDWVEV